LINEIVNLFSTLQKMSKPKVIIEDLPEIPTGKLEVDDEDDIIQDIKRTKNTSNTPFAKPKPLVKKVNRPKKQPQTPQVDESNTTTTSNQSNTSQNDQMRVVKERFERLLIFLAKLNESELYYQNVKSNYDDNLKNGNMKSNPKHIFEN
jgi:hypothetical protein